MANHSVIHEDFWRYYAGTMPATAVGIRDLQQIRGVSRGMRDVVDMQLGADDWRTSLLARGTVYCQTHLNQHLQNDQFAMAMAMQEFLEDERTQLTILTSLTTFLKTQNATMFYATPHPHQQPQIPLIGMYRAVTQSLRRHHRHLGVLRIACAVLALLPPLIESVSCPRS